MTPLSRSLATPFLAVFAACGSITEHRVPVLLTAPGYQMPLDLWASDRGDTCAVHLLVWDSLLWPVDAVVSFGWGVGALVSPDIEIRGGPFGLLAAMALPLCTARMDSSGRFLDQSPAAVMKGRRLPDPVLLEVADEEVERWLDGSMPLRELAASGVGAACRRVLREGRLWERFDDALRVQLDVLEGRIPVTRAGELTRRELGR